MSAKCKKTKTEKVEKEIRHISQSESKIASRLSLSFYGERVLRMQKQVILDHVDNEDGKIKIDRELFKHDTSNNQKVNKSKAPIIGNEKHEQILTRQQNQKSNKTQNVNAVCKSQERSSSKSSRGKKSQNKLLKYLSNRIDITGKDWVVLKVSHKPAKGF